MIPSGVKELRSVGAGRVLNGWPTFLFFGKLSWHKTSSDTPLLEGVPTDTWRKAQVEIVPAENGFVIIRSPYWENESHGVYCDEESIVNENGTLDVLHAKTPIPAAKLRSSLWKFIHEQVSYLQCDASGVFLDSDRAPCGQSLERSALCTPEPHTG